MWRIILADVRRSRSGVTAARRCVRAWAAKTSSSVPSRATIGGSSSLSSLSSAWDYAQDVVQSGRLNPPNPLSDHVAELRERLSSSSSSDDGVVPLPPFADVRPRHWAPAARSASEDRAEAQEELLGVAAAELDDERACTVAAVTGLLTRSDDAEAAPRHVRRVVDAALCAGVHGDRAAAAAADARAASAEDGARPSAPPNVVEALRRARTRLSGTTTTATTTDDDETTRRRRLSRALGKLSARVDRRRGDDEKTRAAVDRLRRAEAVYVPGARPLPARESVPAMYEILRARRDLARSRGLDSFAEVCWDDELGERSLRPEDVRVLHDVVRARAVPAARRVVAGRSPSEKFAPPAFYLHDALDGLFALTERLFGIRTEEETDLDDAHKWHRDVRLFRLRDVDSGTLLGSFYLDPFLRPHKRQGEWTAPLIDRRPGVAPLVSVSLYGEPPVWDDSPALMTFEQVRALFHEFGHVLEYAAATEVGLDSVSGPDTAESDEREFVSQFMEYWLYDEAVLTSVSPRDHANVPGLLDRLRRRRYHDSALKFPLQSFVGQLELDLHSSDFDPENDSVFALHRSLAETYLPHDAPVKGDLSFLHRVFRDGSEGQHLVIYKYLWGDVRAADAYRAFEEASDDDDVAEVGRRFRREILAPGGDVPAAEAYRAFRGRDPDPEALFQYHGMAATTTTTTTTTTT